MHMRQTRRTRVKGNAQKHLVPWTSLLAYGLGRDKGEVDKSWEQGCQNFASRITSAVESSCQRKNFM